MSLGLIINASMPLSSSKKLNFGVPMHDHSKANWKEFVCCQMGANKTFSESKIQFSVINREVLMNSQSSSYMVVHS